MAEESRTPDLAERTRLNLGGAARGEIDSILGDLAPDAVWEVDEYGFHVDGAPAIRSFMRKWTANLDDWSFQLEEVTDLGHELVLVAYRQSGRAAGSSFALEDRGFQIYEWRNGLIVGIRLYSHIDEARAAAAALTMQKQHVEDEPAG
jgi:ketosteroid isomerase-like protein